MRTEKDKGVGLITFHFVNNFGGALQAYALYRVLETQCGLKPVMIDYRNWFISFTDAVRLLPITHNWAEICSGIHTMRLRMGRIKKFSKFRRENFALTGKYFSNGAIKRARLPYCRYVCGSDQIWNPILTGGVSKPYYLDFADKNAVKVSYAPSLGTAVLPRIFRNQIKSLVQDIDMLSVRERSAKQVIESMTGRDVSVLIDPTFLLEKDEWENLAVKPQLPKEYILLYIMQNDARMYDYVRDLKNRVRLPVIEISRYGYRPDFIDKQYIDVGPAEFVGLLINAKYICTNSYHGLVFSIVFSKKLFLMSSKKFGMRMSNLLELLDIHIPGGLKNGEFYELEYDEGKVWQRIREEQKKSVSYLCASLCESNEPDAVRTGE